MQLKIDIKFRSSTESLLIDLIDNPGVCAWGEYCKKLPQSRSVIKQGIATNLLVANQSQWVHQQLVQQELSKTSLPIPLPVSTPEEITQHHLNVWHRWFTEHSQRIITNNPSWFDDYIQGITTDNLELSAEYYWLNELNQVVHVLESTIHEYPKKELSTAGLEFNFQPKLDRHGFKIGYVDLAPHRQYHSWEHADLILDQAVHGKTTMQSFIDNDDPNHWDTTGHHMSWGGCKLVNGTYRQEIYQGPLFRKWMDQNAVTYQDLWGDYPLGNIVNRDQDQLDRIFCRWREDFVSVNLIILG
jgi:hypothetical protein